MIFYYHLLYSSYQWIMKHGGIPTEDSYGNYLGIDGFCHVDDPSTVMGLQVMCKFLYLIDGKTFCVSKYFPTYFAFFVCSLN